MKEEVPQESFNQYIGIPYALEGRSKTALDCWGLVFLVGKEQFKLDLPSFLGYASFEEAHEKLNLEVPLFPMKKVSSDEAAQGDIVLMNMGAAFRHVGLYIGNSYVLHCTPARGVVRSRVNSIQHLIEGFYRVENQQ